MIVRQNENNTASWNLVGSSQWFSSNRRQTRLNCVQLTLLTCWPDECWCVVEMISAKTYWFCPFDRIPVLVDLLLCSMIERRTHPSVDSELEPPIEHFPMLHSFLEFQAWSQTFTNSTRVIYVIIQMIGNYFWQYDTRNWRIWSLFENKLAADEWVINIDDINVKIVALSIQLKKLLLHLKVMCKEALYSCLFGNEVVTSVSFCIKSIFWVISPLVALQ